MEGKPITIGADVMESAAGSLSRFEFPPDVRFADDREGVEARILIAGYADRLAYAARAHEPVQMVREIVGRIVEITARASHREMARLVAQSNGRGH
jgi:hypothetical protein